MGELCALLTAVMWAAAVIYLRRSGETIPPFALNVFRIAVSTVFLIATMLVMGRELLIKAPTSDYLILFASGVIAIAVSDTFFLMALNRLGAGIMAIVDCLYAPFVVLFAFVILGERLGPWQWAGMAFVIFGVLIAARHEPPHGITAKQVFIGSVYGLIAMATVALGIVIAKPVLDKEETGVLWATTMRQLGALAVMIPAALVLPSRRQIFSLFRPAPNWKFSVPGTLLGSYFALIFWVAGMKYAMAGIAAILNQTSSIYVLIFASIFLKEPFTLRKAIATALAISGIVMVTLG